MYPLHLGKFTLPESGYWLDPKKPDWVEHVRYQPEPPVAVRGGMNPWADERQREIFTAEEANWVTIQAEQTRYTRARKLAEAKIQRFNQVVRELEALTGKPSGLFTVDNIAAFIAGSSGNPYIMAALGVKMLVQMFMGSSEKRKLQRMVQELETLQADILALHHKMQTIEANVKRLMQVGASLRDLQGVRIQAVATANEAAYTARQNLERERGRALQRQALMLPRSARQERGITDAL